MNTNPSKMCVLDLFLKQQCGENGSVEGGALLFIVYN